MKCASCGNVFNDGVQCGGCKKHLDFGCASITEVGWRKLGPDRRSAWRCSSCRSQSASPPITSAPASLEAILGEIRDIKRQLMNLPALIDDVKNIKTELSDLKTSCEYTSSKIDDYGSQLAAVERRVSNLEKLEETVNLLQNDITSIKALISAGDQRSRLNNAEIKGVPLKKDENLFTIIETISNKIGYKFPKSQINYISRVPLHNSKDKSIVVSFLNRYVKEDFVAAARATKILTVADIGWHDSSQRIYINDHLNADSKNLLNRARSLAKDKNYSYVWVKFGKIHIRKNETSHVFIISKESDLNKIS